MTTTTADVLRRLWSENEAVIRSASPLGYPPGYIDGLRAANWRIRATMAGLEETPAVTDTVLINGRNYRRAPWPQPAAPDHSESR